MKLSVVICTYNRCHLIEETIQSVINQKFDGFYEIVVVDNNSNDDTYKLIQSYIQINQDVFKYVFEKEQGLSSARNAGIKSSVGDLILFVDDDAVVGRDWLGCHASAYSDANVFCAGGPILPIWPREKPAWLAGELLAYLSLNEFQALYETREFREPDFPWGTNISFRREAFREYGMFPVHLGRVGQSLLSNEEHYLCKKIQMGGKRIRFVPEAVVYHTIPRERVTRPWFYRRAFAQGRSDALLEKDFGRDSHNIVPELLNRIIKISLNSSSSTENDKVINKCSDRYLLGYLYEYFGISQNDGKLKCFRFRKNIFDVLNKFRTQSVNYKNKYIESLAQTNKIRDEFLNSRTWRWTQPLRRLLAYINNTNVKK